MTSILDAIVYLFINAFDTYLMYLFMRLFFKNDFISKKAAVFVYSLYYVVSTLVYALFSFVFLNMISSIIVTFIVTLCYRSKISKKNNCNIIELCYHEYLRGCGCRRYRIRRRRCF